LSFGRRDHDALLTSFDDNKKILNLKNIFNEAYRFNMRCLHPAVVPIQYAVLYMLQSGSYILSPDFISTFKKMDLHEAQILWHMVFLPQESTLQGVLSLLFDARSYGLKVSFIFLIFSHYVHTFYAGIEAILSRWDTPFGRSRGRSGVERRHGLSFVIRFVDRSTFHSPSVSHQSNDQHRTLKLIRFSAWQSDTFIVPT
jgi:hypothetical protein